MIRNLVIFALALVLGISPVAAQTIGGPVSGGGGGSGPPSGAAGGDLNGTYPNPLVSGVSGLSGIATISPATTTASTASVTMSPSWSFSSTASGIGPIIISPVLNPTGASGGNIYGLNIAPTVSGAASADVGTLRAIQLQVATAAGYSGTLGSGIGLRIVGVSAGGTNPITASQGITIDTTANGNGITTGTVTNTGLNIANFTSAAGVGGTLVDTGLKVTLSNGSSAGNTDRAIWITGNGGAASTKYAIYSDSTALSQIAGPVTMSNATITLSGVTTGTNADFLCLSAGSVVLLQTSACTISSMRFKREMIPLPTNENIGLRTIAKLRPTAFNMIEDRAHPNPDVNFGRRQIGLIAENVAAVDQRLAIFEQDGVTPKSYRQESVIAVLVKGMQEQQAEISDLRREVQELRSQRR